METLISTPIGVVAGLSIIVAVTLLLQRFKFFKFLGPVMTCILLGVLLSNTRVLPFEHDAYSVFFTYGIPLTITMFLISINIREWIKLAKQPLKAMLIASLSVFVMGLLGGLIFAPGIEEGWKIAGMFTGTYIGGSGNLAAVGTGLEASSSAFAAANAADYVVGMPLMILLFALPNIFMKSKKVQKLWPYTLPDNILYEEGAGNIFDDTKCSVEEIAILFMLGFVVNAVATKISTYCPPSIAGAIRIISMTTISLILGQFKFFNKLRGGHQLGICISLYFLAVIGVSINLKQFLTSAPLIALMCAFICFGALIIHLIFCRLFKIPYQYMIASITAAIVDGPTSALVCSSANWTGVVGTAIVLGAVGGALGNYLGFSVAFLIKNFLAL